MKPTGTVEFASIPLHLIVTSQTNPRKHFNLDKLHELAESIRASGVHQPVLVRPLPGARVADTAHLDPRPQWELISGERRLRASIAAEMDTIPAMVRVLTDDQVLEIQLVENLQRDDLTPLEEAEGYDALMQAHEPALTAEQIGQRIGKSRSYVYGRLKLLALCPEGRDALQQGHIVAAVAESIARIPDTRVQAQALGNVFNPMTGDAMPVREARALIQRQYMLRLAEAPFPLDSNNWMSIQTEPACTHCTRRTGADPDLFAESHNTDLCMDLGCYKAKQSAWQHLQLEAARKTGATIIEGREAREIITPTADGRLEGYLRLDDRRDSPEKGQTLRQIIGSLMESEGIKPTLLVDPASKNADTIAVIDTATAQRLLAQQAQADQVQQIKAKGAKASKEAERAADELQKRKDHEHYWNTWTWRLMERAWARINAMEAGMYSLPEAVIRLLARNHLPNAQDRAERLCTFLGLGKVAPAPALAEWVNEHPDPDRALALIMLFNAATTSNLSMTETADRFAMAMAISEDRGVDIKVQDIKDEVEAEHTAEIRARNKVQAGQAGKDPAQASAPKTPAAQAGGVRGKAVAKGGKPRKPAAALTVGAEEAMRGIATAMQGNETGGDCAPGDPDPAVGAAAGADDGRATAPDAGAAFPVPGARIRFVGVHMTGQLGHIIEEATFGTGKWLILVDGLTSEYVFERHEFEIVSEEEGATA